MATKKTAEEIAEAEEQKVEEQRQKDSHKYVGTIVHYFPAPAEGYNPEESERLEKERREADPLAAIVTSVQPDGVEGQMIVNLQVFAPDGTSPSFGVDFISAAKEGRDGKPYCYPV